jgi:MFS family permease
VIPSILMLIFHQYIPESPKWLLSKQKLTSGSQDFSANPMNKQVANSSTGGLSSEVYQAVYNILKHLRPSGYNIDEEIKLILVDVKKDAALKQDVSWSEVFSWRNAMIIGCGLMLFQAITGINSIVFYSTTIFQLAGFSQSIIGTALFGIVNFFMTGVAAYCIDKAGRKILLLGGTYVM